MRTGIFNFKTTFTVYQSRLRRWLKSLYGKHESNETAQKITWKLVLTVDIVNTCYQNSQFERKWNWEQITSWSCIFLSYGTFFSETLSKPNLATVPLTKWNHSARSRLQFFYKWWNKWGGGGRQISPPPKVWTSNLWNTKIIVFSIFNMSRSGQERTLS